MARTVVLEATAPPAVDWSAARIYRVIVTVRGRPCAAFWAPSPGRLRDPERFTRALLEPGTTAAAYEREYERFRARMGMERRPAWPRPTCTVIVCTHRRSTYLPGLLEAVRRLDPPPDEFIVVDNDPGAEDSRQVIEAAGATYLREDRRGLDHARMAGLRAAGGELVAFTDDDCVPAARWLADLGELFAPASVAAVTGPAFAWELDSPAQLRFELEGGFSRGLKRRNFDWTVLSPLDAGAVGAGANMIFRRSVLAAMADPFPGELDAGTKTQSGGDMYALYRLLAAGHRVVYDPGTYVFHRHRRDPASLHHAFWGYGVGLSAVMAKLLLEEAELEAPSSWMWLWHQYRAVQLRRLVGKAESRQVRVAWDYLRGGFSGPGAWWAARRELGSRPAEEPPRDLPDEVPPAPPRVRHPPADAAPAPALSVVVPTAGRPDALARCLAALAPQRAGGEVEIVVVDDGVPPTAAVPGDPDQIVRSGGRGAAAARNVGARAARGRLLLFLDDDLVPAPDLVARHRERHEDGPRAVVGYCPPGPRDAGLAEQAAALWWHDHFELMADSARLTFTGFLSGNLSLPRRTFLELGGFDEEVGRLRREDWLFGLVALDSGLEVTYAPEAVAVHEFRLPVRARLRAAHAEGRGDALLIAHRPELELLLDAPVTRGWRPASLAVRGWAQVAARPRAIAAACATLDLLERARMRRRWLRGFQVAQAASYTAGRQAGAAPASRTGVRAKLPVVDAAPDAPFPAPRAFATPFGLLAGGRRPEPVVPEYGTWDRSVAHSAASIVMRAEQRHALEARQETVPAAALPLLAFGPAHRRGEDILVRDTDLRIVHAGGDHHWEAIDAAVRAASDTHVVAPMPRVVPTRAWCEAVAERLDGDRVAVVFGVNVRPSSVGGAPLMRARFGDPERYPTIDGPFLFVAVRRDRFLELGGFRAGLDRFGPYAAPLELAERALDAGLVVMHERVPGAGVIARRRGVGDRREWARQRARGALSTRDALVRGGPALPVLAGRGAAPLAVDGVRRHYPPHVAAGRLLAYAIGALEAGAAAFRR
jgi:glycosyltransferase involved in cell wall biosynthesis